MRTRVSEAGASAFHGEIDALLFFLATESLREVLLGLAIKTRGASPGERAWSVLICAWCLYSIHLRERAWSDELLQLEIGLIWLSPERRGL